MPLADRFGRTFRRLRISVTEACNYRCVYCAPEEFSPAAARKYLTFAEVERVAAVAVRLGMARIRLTGGEPTLRPRLPDLVARLAALPGIEDLGMTSNGERLGRLAEDLAAAGLMRINLSLDSLDPERFRRVTQGGDLKRVLAALDRCLAARLKVKVNAVILPDLTDADILALVALSRERSVEVRFLEYMPLCGSAWNPKQMVPAERVLSCLRVQHDLTPLPRTQQPPQATQPIPPIPPE